MQTEKPVYVFDDGHPALHACDISGYTRFADGLRSIRSHAGDITSAAYQRPDGSLRLVAFFAFGPVELGTTEVLDGVHGLEVNFEGFEGAEHLQDLALEVLALHVPT